ncbi:MAG TPA: choice-of-anchor D domain-containing protein [Bryobacteraceae bacterium]|nr:choice-of-anchor D domain-containing protein [Bryobacteraceae bacterium]
MHAGHLDFRVTGPANQRNWQRDRRKYAGAALFLAALFVMDRSAPAPTPDNTSSQTRGGDIGTGGVDRTPKGTSDPKSDVQSKNNVPTRVARIVVTPTQIKFASLEVGAASPAQVVTFQNVGTARGALGKITLSDSMNFRFDRATCAGGELDPQAKCYVEVSFHPAMPGSPMATLARTGSDTVQLSGHADPKIVVPAAPTAQFDQKMYSYGELETNTSLTKIPVLKNIGTTAIQDLRFRLAGDHIEDFSPRIPNCVPLQPGALCGVPVTFLANHEGQHEVFLVALSEGKELDRSALDGGVRPRPVPKADISPNPAEFDNKQRMQTLYIRNNGDGNLKFDQFAVDNGNDFVVDPSACLRVPPLGRGESCPVQVTFKGKKSAQAIMTVLDNDPTRSQRVPLAANISKSDRKKWLTGLLITGAITATAYEVASHSGGDKTPPVETKPTQPNTPNRNSYQLR